MVRITALKVKGKRVISSVVLSERDKDEREKRKRMEQLIERLFTLRTFDPQEMLDKRHPFFQNKLRTHIEKRTKFGKSYITSAEIRAYGIDYIHRDQDKPIFLALELDKIKGKSTGETKGLRSWTKLADVCALLKVWIYMTNQDRKSADEDFNLATKRLSDFLKYRGDIDEKGQVTRGFGRFIALRVLTNKKYAPRKKVIAWKYGKEL